MKKIHKGLEPAILVVQVLLSTNVPQNLDIYIGKCNFLFLKYKHFEKIGITVDILQ